MTQPPTITHSLESLYDVLESRRRRFVLYHLREAPDDVSQLDAVKEQIHEWETNSAQQHGGDHDEEDIAAMLHHQHLPKLAGLGVIDYDWRTKTIRYRPDELLEAHLDLAEEHDFP